MKLTSLFPAAALLLAIGLHPVRAQNTTFTYQGRVQDNGTNFTGIGQFKFALLTATNTSSLPQVALELGGTPGDLMVVGVQIQYGGSGYVTAPAITFPPGQPSAQGFATVSGESITAITVTSEGLYPYNGENLVLSIAPPPADFTNLAVWSNDGTTGIGISPVGSVALGVTNGLFTVHLGDPTDTGMATLPASVFNQTGLQLQIWFNDGVNGFLPFPAQTLTPAPLATLATSANALNGQLPLGQLPAGTLTNGSSGVSLAGNFSGNGGALTGLSAANLAGTIADGRLSTNVALRAGGNAFAGNQTITSGCLGIGLANPTYPLELASNGVVKMTLDCAGNLACSGTVSSQGLALTSDRNAKENFAPVDHQAVLARVAALPVTKWNYKTDPKGVQHIGPMAQDFQAAFGLAGGDERHIYSVDEAGVALAAIQGLNEQLKDKDAQIRQLARQLADLQATVNQLSSHPHGRP